MTREQLKALANEIKAEHHQEGSAKGYMQFIIAAQDSYIDELTLIKTEEILNEMNIGWQPISVAPKDGTEILWRSKHSGSMCVIRYPYYSECYDNTEDSWMPLPTPPKQGK